MMYNNPDFGEEKANNSGLFISINSFRMNFLFTKKMIQ